MNKFVTILKAVWNGIPKALQYLPLVEPILAKIWPSQYADYQVISKKVKDQLKVHLSRIRKEVMKMEDALNSNDFTAFVNSMYSLVERAKAVSQKTVKNIRKK